MGAFEASFDLRAPPEAVWSFHADPGGLARITPKPVRVAVDAFEPPLRAGSRIRLTMGAGPLRSRWELVVTGFDAGVQFVDEQVSGPFARWRHTHRFEPIDGGTRVIDRIEYELPFGRIGRLADALGGRLAMRVLFALRRWSTRRLLDRPDQRLDELDEEVLSQ